MARKGNSEEEKKEKKELCRTDKCRVKYKPRMEKKKKKNAVGNRLIGKERERERERERKEIGGVKSRQGREEK